MLFLQLFATFYFENREFLKNSNWNMPATPGEMHMYDMVKIDTIVFEIVGGGGGGLLKPPPDR